MIKCNEHPPGETPARRAARVIESLESVPPTWRRMCGGGFCACMGCAGILGVTSEELDAYFDGSLHELLWADNGWRDPVNDRPGEREEVLVLVRYNDGPDAVIFGWLGRDDRDEFDGEFGDVYWKRDSEIEDWPSPIESGCKVIGWQHKPAPCSTPACYG